MSIRKITLVISIALIGTFYLKAQTPDWLWATQAGGISYDYCNSIVIDSGGNQYVTGYFSGTANFGSTSLTSTGSSDIFVAKLDTNGNWLWAKKAGGSLNDYGRGIAVDNSGNAYLTGIFNQEAIFGTTLLTSAGYEDIFVAKLDSNGTWMWAIRAGNGSYYAPGVQGEDSYAIAVDNSSNVYLTGFFHGAITFGTINLLPYGYGDVFIAKLNTDGSWLWATRAGSGDPNCFDIGYDIAVDNSGNVYLTGSFMGQEAHFGNSYNYASMGYRDIFIAKLSTIGNWLWVRTAGGSNHDYGQGISLDSSANVYLTGYFYGTTYFGSTSLTSTGSSDIFVAKLSNSGVLLWAKKAGGSNRDSGYAVDTDSQGNLYVIGSFFGTATFGATTLTSNGGEDMYIAKLDGNGSWLRAVGAGGTFDDNARSITIDNLGNQYVSGIFLATATFGPYTITSTGGSDIYVAKLSITNNYTVSGNVLDHNSIGIEGVTVTATDATPIETTSAGSYQFTVQSGWSGSITASKTGWIFLPASRSYENVTANFSNQNFAGNVAGPELTGLSVIQRMDESRIVDIYYNVAHTGPVTVSLQVSDDAGQTWDVDCLYATHDIGANISPGRGKRIEWDVLAEEIGMMSDWLTFKITASDNLASSYLVSDEVEIFVDDTVYSDYRIVPVALAPNPAVLSIPEGGTGYAWFVVEGLHNGFWKPIKNIELLAEDEQGHIIICQTRNLPYQFLSNLVHMQNAGVFALPIDYFMIGSMQLYDTETITVTTANSQPIPTENQQSITCRIVPYSYDINWEYRVYGRLGLGTPGVLSLTGFVGGGSGAGIGLDLRGPESVPDWSNVRIKRKSDLFLGAELELEPPALINVGNAQGSSQTSFPYESEYHMNLSDGLYDAYESLLALYLLGEPLVAFASPIHSSIHAAKFIGVMAEMVLGHFSMTNITDRRVSDEAGLDIEGNLSFNTNMLGPNLGLSMGPSINGAAHCGAGAKSYASGLRQAKINIGGQMSLSNNAGISPIPSLGAGVKYFYPHRLNANEPATFGEIEYEGVGTYDNLLWQSLKLSSSMATDASWLNIYNLPGSIHKSKSWLEAEGPLIGELLNLPLHTVDNVLDIGANAVSMAVEKTSFSDDFASIMNYVYEEQNRDHALKLKTGHDFEDLSIYDVDLSFEIPIPVFPLSIDLGLGFEGRAYRDYEISRGYWVKGYPYLQTEMFSLPQTNLTNALVINEIKNKITVGGLWDDLAGYLAMKFHNTVVRILGSPGRITQTLTLNDLGSTLTLNDNCFPAGADSVLCRYWVWSDEPVVPGLDQREREIIINFNRNLRTIYQEASNMRYGIGGFFSFEGSDTEWNEDPLIKIHYSNEDIIGLDENTLGLFWEDASGVWNYLNSTVVADSNYVYGYLPYIATYTLAPRLPQGDFGFSASPDSLLADGTSLATITSDILFNNDGTLVANGQTYTVSSSRGTILTTDADPTTLGTQVLANSGTISFVIQSDQIPLPVSISASATTGYSSGSLELSLYSSLPPQTPLLLTVQPEHRSLKIAWEESSAPGVVGYRIYYDIDIPAAPFTGTSNVDGLDSPVFVGMTSEYILSGLYNEDVYYVAVTAIDASGRESAYSNVLTGQPSLREVQEVNVEWTAAGINLDWSPAVGAESYKIYRNPDPYAPISQMTLVGQTNSLTWTDYDTVSLAKMFYRIVAIGY